LFASPFATSSRAKIRSRCLLRRDLLQAEGPARLPRLRFGRSCLGRRERRHQLLRRDRLFDDPEQLHAVGRGHRLHRRDERTIERARQDHRDRNIPACDMANELHSVHAGHVQVADDDIDRLVEPSQDLEGRLAVAGFEDLRCSKARQHPAERLALEFVVFHDQDAQVRDLHPDGSVAIRWIGSWFRPSSWPGSRA
jgi:hypothetical protein